MIDKNTYCVIMAGGIGSRFWPLSKTKCPKQFLDILGVGKTLLQQTYERFLPICPVENILIVTNADYTDLVLEQLPALKPEQVLNEPMRRNTAPCIAFANYKIAQLNPDANIIVSPADHLILNNDLFLNNIQKGIDFVSQNDALLTIGIQPTRPETGYGYIQAYPQEADSDAQKVKTFTEKPNAELAQVFIDSGDFFWNSGIFLWSLASIQSAFTKHLNDVAQLFIPQKKLGEDDFIQKAYAACKSISIDYGILEKSDNVFMIGGSFGWSDLGTWSAMFDNSEKTANNNLVRGDNIFTYDTENTIIVMPNNKLAVVDGLKDYIVSESDNTLLICRRENEQNVKQFVTDIQLKNKDEFI